MYIHTYVQTAVPPAVLRDARATMSGRRRPGSRNAGERRTSRREVQADIWRSAAVIVPLRKQAISLRVDEDVLAWFKARGPRYQSRMNAVLRSYMDVLSAGTRRRST